VQSVLVPCGGGGLISGIAAVLRRVSAATKIIACETDTSQPFATAIAAGRPAVVQHTPSFVDGIGGRTVLQAMWPMIQQAVDSVAITSLSETADAIRALAIDHHVIAEGAGGVPVAAALAGHGIGRTVCIVSGGNLAAAKLSAILNGELPGVG
jgi:threonine dehydratase